MLAADMVKVFNDSTQITYTITVAILKAAWVNLIQGIYV